VFWAVDPDWIDHRDPEAADRLGLTATDLDDFTWAYTIPLEVEAAVDGVPAVHHQRH
jgi:hypothetical protein